MAEIIDAGIKEFLPKPFPTEKLLEKNPKMVIS